MDEEQVGIGIGTKSSNQSAPKTNTETRISFGVSWRREPQLAKRTLIVLCWGNGECGAPSWHDARELTSAALHGDFHVGLEEERLFHKSVDLKVGHLSRLCERRTGNACSLCCMQAEHD